MKTKIVAVLTAVSGLLFAMNSQAQILAAQSGNWSNPSTWQGNAVPSTNAIVEIDTPIVVTNDNTEGIFNIIGSGTVTMAASSELDIASDAPLGSFTGTLNATAVGNTINYQANAYTIANPPKTTQYYNLTLSAIGGSITYNSAAISVAGTLTLSGVACIQGGTGLWTVGNLIVTNDGSFNCSGSGVIVTNNTIISSPGTNAPPPATQHIGTGGLTDSYGDNQSLANQLGNVTILPNGAWVLGDVVQWAVSGNLTNNGSITGTPNSRITFDGNGTIAGSPFTVPACSFYGTNTLLTDITNTYVDFFTNYAALTFNLASPGEVVVTSTNGIAFTGNLNLVDGGATPPNGMVFPLFNASNYFGTFINITSDFNFVNNLYTAGSITFTGGVVPTAPKITSVHYVPATQQYTVTWTSTAGTMYSVQETTSLNNGVVSWGTLATGITGLAGTTSKTVTVPGGKTGFLRVSTP